LTDPAENPYPSRPSFLEYPSLERFRVTNLRKMRQFYRMFEIRDAVRLVSAVETIRHTAWDELS
jgi:hypothetical protein